tara:strand:- start:1393 stop:1950 length:558 start_codon:yes stop_codon:yes gene_type:complete
MPSDRFHLPDSFHLDVSVEEKGWRVHFADPEIEVARIVTALFHELPETANIAAFPHLELSVVLTDDAAIRVLNRDYRDKDKATNVLSFPGLDEAELKQFFGPEPDLPEYPLSLGDIILALETVEKEAISTGKTVADHFTHLVVHGFLHLLGYDHIDEKDAEVMEALEKRLLATFGIDDPYQEMST